MKINYVLIFLFLWCLPIVGNSYELPTGMYGNFTITNSQNIEITGGMHYNELNAWLKANPKTQVLEILVVSTIKGVGLFYVVHIKDTGWNIW